MNRLVITLGLLLFFKLAIAQNTNPAEDASRQQYLQELKRAGREFTKQFYPAYTQFYKLPEQQFTFKIDSVRNAFNAILSKYTSTLPVEFARNQSLEIKYYFDKLLIEYPDNHNIYLGSTHSSYKIPGQLKENMADFNKPVMLSNTDFTNYVKAFLEFRVNKERSKRKYQDVDNQHLAIVWDLLPKFFSNEECLDFWKYNYLFNHIENDGIKNIGEFYADFKSTSKDTSHFTRVAAIYKEDSLGREGHLIKTYKTIGKSGLDMHMFIPNENIAENKRPLIVYFHGGSWSEGKPDWFFAACESYAKKGWVACAVEYRTYGRYGTLPFDAVKDAKSAIRWLRENADEYKIDTSRIVASGNSAGGHLVLATAIADRWNEKTDDLRFSSVPNLLMINSGVYTLMDQGTAWIRRDLKNKQLAEEISPNYLIRKYLPPTLIIHGTKDGNVPYTDAAKFVEEMRRAGNSSIEFHPLKDATHFIWIDPKYASDISAIRTAFLSKNGF